MVLCKASVEVLKRGLCGSADSWSRVLATARANGDLSQFEYLVELKRRGVLRNDFSQQDKADRLATEYVAA